MPYASKKDSKYMSKLSTLKTSHKIAAGLVGAALLVAAPAYAATSAGITLTGSVQQILNLTVTATTAGGRPPASWSSTPSR